MEMDDGRDWLHYYSLEVGLILASQIIKLDSKLFLLILK
jgi:hypothetical protein